MKPTGSPADTRLRSTSGSRRADLRRRLHQCADLVHIENEIAYRVDFKCRSESGAPLELVIPVGISRVHCLGEGIVETLDQDEQLSLPLFQVLSRLSVERTLLIDWVNHRPRDW